MTFVVKYDPDTPNKTHVKGHCEIELHAIFHRIRTKMM